MWFLRIHFAMLTFHTFSIKFVLSGRVTLWGPYSVASSHSPLFIYLFTKLCLVEPGEAFPLWQPSWIKATDPVVSPVLQGCSFSRRAGRKFRQGWSLVQAHIVKRACFFVFFFLLCPPEFYLLYSTVYFAKSVKLPEWIKILYRWGTMVLFYRHQK